MPSPHARSKHESWLMDQVTKSEFFHQKLHEYGLLETAYAIEKVRGEALDWNREGLGISEKAWNKVIHRGIKPVRVFARYCQMLWIKASSAANIDGVSVNTSGAGSDWSISASPLGNSTPALTRATR